MFAVHYSVFYVSESIVWRNVSMWTAYTNTFTCFVAFTYLAMDYTCPGIALHVPHYRIRISSVFKFIF